MTTLKQMAEKYAEFTPVKDILAMADCEGPEHLKKSRYYAFLAGAEAERRRIVDIIEVARCYVGGPVDEITLGYEYLIKEIAKDGGESE